LGREYLGIEVNLDYVKGAESRLNGVARDLLPV